MKAILINIFGGIVRCDRVAGGVIEAVKKTQDQVPVVVRLEGTNADIAAKMLSESGLQFRRRQRSDRRRAKGGQAVTQAKSQPESFMKSF